MKLKHLPLCAIVLALESCFEPKAPHTKSQSAVPSDTLTYQYKTVRERASDCGNKADTSCTTALIKYPEFSGDNALNDTVAAHLANLFSVTENGAISSLQDAAKALVASYENNQKKLAAAHIHYSLNSQASVIRQDSTLITLELSGYEFKGGAHGLTLTRFINWDTRQHKNLQLNDVFVEGYEPKLNAIAEKVFRKEELLSDSASLSQDYFFKGGKFSLNNNFSFTPLGIRFLYNVYEIKPYAAGQTSIEIPYNQLKKLLRPGTPLAIYLR